ncbi:hypothetical protein B0F90DRAFT_1768684 [Multifurca ochricompacta]|uniref:Secreted protein n=1 Tax=Multifurca ochricompacta TaxID=376703 RepID=A0AAD4LXW4_9AGAM|nr:hypothetical protein B0F90DRAFT_1768684 [Multifurca ochricompacta]
MDCIRSVRGLLLLLSFYSIIHLMSGTPPTPGGEEGRSISLCNIIYVTCHGNRRGVGGGREACCWRKASGGLHLSNHALCKTGMMMMITRG